MPTPDEVFELGARALLAARDHNRERWAAAHALLAPATALWCVGLGKSGIVAQKLSTTLRSFGRTAHALHPVDALHGDAGAMGTNDAIVAISSSGHTTEVLRFLRGSPLPIVALTDPVSPLAALASATLDARVLSEAGGDAPMTSFLVACALADALALQLRDGGRLAHPGGFVGLGQRSAESLMRPPRLVPGSLTVAACIPHLGDGAVLVEGGGIFTDGDLRRAVGADPGALSRPVSELCTREPVTVRVGEPASLALDRMERRSSQLTVLPVVDESGAYVGLVRLHDLVRAGLGA
ncbi:MAG: SIS domain-containing protein [Myxococcales bacterium]|nr:SIS domain-containing protein [Myxococcales bacterium]